LITLATKHLADEGMSYSSIDSGRYEIEVNGDIYSIKDKNQINMFSHVYLNIIIGLSKK